MYLLFNITALYLSTKGSVENASSVTHLMIYLQDTYTVQEIRFSGSL